MTRTARTAVVLSAAGLPAILWAFSRGPDPRVTGAPGDSPLACASAGCHVGTPVNGGGGNVALSFSSGATYTPGATIRVTVTITDSQARNYGFQASARLASDLRNGQAGDFRPGQSQIVLCDNGNTKPQAGCPANFAVQFIEHTAPSSTNRFEFDWVAPATNVGDVVMFVAANAANSDGNSTGDRIYTTNTRLTPAAVTNPRPAINSGGVVTALAYGGGARMAPGTWLEIYGSNFLNEGETRTWDNAFQGDNAPTALGDLSVTIGGTPAPIWFAVNNQINVQVPNTTFQTGPLPIVVRRGSQQSDAFSLNLTPTAPGLLAPSAFNLGGTQFVGAIFPNTNPPVFAIRAVPGVQTRLARPGDTLIVYGIGFGTVTPDVAPGVIARAATQLTRPVTFRVGQSEANVLYQGLAPNFIGLYQFNITIPAGLAPGVYPLAVTQGGQPVPQTVSIEIGQ
ncbi:MAG: IPT/TIG domain-containing protein [Bryobacteraceae bacterium]|nr:IPT/TIG domain-containing protein [Bryobacteraceae bacterium]